MIVLGAKHTEMIRRFTASGGTVERAAALIGVTVNELEKALDHYDRACGYVHKAECAGHLMDLQTEEGPRSAWPVWSGPYRKISTYA